MSATEIRYYRNAGRRRANDRRYHCGKSRWKRGLLPGRARATIQGMFGEGATARWFNEQLGETVFKVDTAYHKRGDGGVDFNVFGQTIDVKATPRPMVRRADHGRLLPLPACIYIFADARNHKVVKLLGWITRKRMCEVSPACRTPIQEATHYNLEPPLEQLEAMSDLVRRLKVEARKCR